MAIQFAPMLLGAGRMAMQALPGAVPYLTAGLAAAPSLMAGKPLEALGQGALGYMGGGLLKRGIGAAGKATPGLLGRVAPDSVDAPGFAQTATRLAGVGIPLAGLAAVPAVAGLARATGRAVPEAARSAAGAVTGAVGLGRAATRQPGALTSPVYPEGAVPDISRYGYPGLIAQQDLLGPHQANIAYQKQLQDLENQNIMRLGNYQLLANDEVRRRDLQRSAAAAQLSTNLATQSQLQLGAQRNAAAMAGQALADVGATTRTQYSYL
jgi:hypothetical protein